MTNNDTLHLLENGLECDGISTTLMQKVQITVLYFTEGMLKQSNGRSLLVTESRAKRK